MPPAKFGFGSLLIRRRSLTSSPGNTRLLRGGLWSRSSSGEVTYGNFIHGLKKENIQLDREVLSEISMREPYSFKALVDISHKSFSGNRHVVQAPRKVRRSVHSSSSSSSMINEESDLSAIFKDNFSMSQDAICCKFFQGRTREGVMFSYVIYVTKDLGTDFWDSVAKPPRIKIFRRGIFLSDRAFDALFPVSLHFVKAVIDLDSDVQPSRDQTLTITRTLLVQSLQLIADLPCFWTLYGECICTGVMSNEGRYSWEFARLLRFKTSKYPHVLISLDQYVDCTFPLQKSVLYTLEDTLKTTSEVEVLFIEKPVNEKVMKQIRSYRNLSLKDVKKRSWLDVLAEKHAGLPKPIGDKLTQFSLDEVFKFMVYSTPLVLIYVLTSIKGFYDKTLPELVEYVSGAPSVPADLPPAPPSAQPSLQAGDPASPSAQPSLQAGDPASPSAQPSPQKEAK